MIAIEVNGIFLELPEEGIRMEVINSSFVTEIYQGDFSFPFVLKDTEINRKALGMPTILEAKERKTKIDCYVWIYELPYKKAIINCIGSGNNFIKINLAGGLRALSIWDKSIRDLDYGPVINLGANATAITSLAQVISQEQDYKVYGFSFVPHKNPQFYGDKNTDFCGVVNRQNSTTGDFYINTFGTLNKYNLVPFVFLFHVLDKIFQTADLTPEGDFYNDTEMQSILLYNNFALDSPTKDDNAYVKTENDYIIFGSAYNYTSLANIKFFKGGDGTFDDAGAWNNTTFEYTIQSPGTIQIDAEIDLFIPNSIDWVACGVYEIRFELYVSGVLINALAITTNEHGLKNLIFSESYTAVSGDVGQKILIKYKLGTINFPPYGFNITMKGTSNLFISNDSDQLNIYEGKMEIKNHLKDVTVSDFLAGLKNLGVSIEVDYVSKKIYLGYNENFVNTTVSKDYTDKAHPLYELNFEQQNKGFIANYKFDSDDQLTENNFKTYRKENYKGDVDTYEQLPAPVMLGSVMLVNNVNKLYIVSLNPSGVGYYWEFFSDNYYPVKLGNGEQEYEMIFTPMFMDYAENEGGTSDQNKCLIPAISQIGSSLMYGQGENDYSIRIVFLRGQNITSGVASPKGGVYMYASSTNMGINGNVIGKYNLRLDSLSSVFMIYVYNFLVALNLGEYVERDILLSYLDILKLDIRTKITIEGIPYIIKSLSIEVKRVLKPVRAILLKLS